MATASRSSTPRSSRRERKDGPKRRVAVSQGIGILSDSAYSSDKLRRSISEHYWAEPIIDPNPGHKKAVAKLVKTPEWKAIYDKRTAIERLNGRLKGFRKLNSVRARGRFKVRIHAMLSVIVCQALALATAKRISVRKVA